MANDPLDVRYERRSDFQTEEVVGELLLLDEAGGLIHQLNPSAGFVWIHCDGVHTVRQIIEKLTEQFEVDAVVAQEDVMQVIRRFCELNLIGD